MKYAAKRIAMLLVTMVIVSLLAFVAFDLISGDPATAMLGTAATPEKVAKSGRPFCPVQHKRRPFPRAAQWR